MEINEVTPPAALQRLREFNTNDLLLFAVERGFAENRLVASLSLNTLCYWLAAHRKTRAFTRVPLVLPVGWVLNMYFAIRSFDSEVCERIMKIGTGAGLHHVSITEKTRGQFLPYNALVKTMAHLETCFPGETMELNRCFGRWVLPEKKLGLFSYTEADRSIDGRNELSLW